MEIELTVFLGTLLFHTTNDKQWCLENVVNFSFLLENDSDTMTEIPLPCGTTDPWYFSMFTNDVGISQSSLMMPNYAMSHPNDTQKPTESTLLKKEKLKNFSLKMTK
jgi:hypothetical protein